MNYYHEKVETDAGIPARISYGGTGRDKLRYPLHWHHNLEFDLVLTGEIRGMVSGREQVAHAGELFFVNSGELHETDGGRGGPLKSITLLLEESLLREYCPELDTLYFQIEKGSKEEQRIGALILECAEFYRKKPAFYELELAIRLRQICGIMLKECLHHRQNADGSAKPEWKSTRKIKQAIAYMEAHFDSGLSIREMGEVMGMSPAYFSRFFKNATGENFHSYLEQIRICRARELLEQEEGSVTEIAFASGFPNVKSFIEAFRREYHTTPAQYRRNRG